MRKIVSFMHVSLDGYVAGPNGELAWVNIGGEVSTDVDTRLRAIGTAMYGRTTYQMMEGYWPTVPANPASSTRDLEHAHWVEQIPKVVISNSLEAVTWNNTTLIRDQITEKLEVLKQQPGGEIMIFGSPRLTHALARLNLIDEYLCYLNPVILGSGTPLFEGAQQPVKLELREEKRFDAGVIALRYRLHGRSD